LILFDAATIVVANSGRTTRNDLTHRTPLKENFGNRRSNGVALLVEKTHRKALPLPK
jgi:hypothetical protein